MSSLRESCSNLDLLIVRLRLGCREVPIDGHACAGVDLPRSVDLWREPDLTKEGAKM